MPPIRLAIIGLSARNASNWAAAAHLGYLLSPRGKSHYTIVALCNSSEEAAHAAIDKFQLGSSTKAYGNPKDLAQDADIDLVVCSTRVDKHYDTIAPSIATGKAVFVEWPLASNISQVRELHRQAEGQNIRSIIGLQGGVMAPITAIRGVLKEGRIGKVLSSEVTARGGIGTHEVIPESLKYFTQRKIGGNVMTITFGHLWDFLQAVLGTAQNICSRVQLQRSDLKLLSSHTGTITETVKSDVPDLAFVTALFEGSDYVQHGAPLCLSFRRDLSDPSEPHLAWTIHGEKGEIRIIAEGGITPRTMASRPVTITVYDFATGERENVSWTWESWLEELPLAARGVAGVYEAYAQGDKASYCDFEHALLRHEQIENILMREC
ncbi:oxidoreductase family protein [Stagonosporopsis vannaccii]|nr:oxidoreductase family protein [Stagonosporopsis vannaccii]